MIVLDTSALIRWTMEPDALSTAATQTSQEVSTKRPLTRIAKASSVHLRTCQTGLLLGQI